MLSEDLKKILPEPIARITTIELEKRAKELNFGRQRFVHYTSASTAMSIIQNQEIWFRNVTCMNDYMEVKFGINELVKAFSTDSPLKIKERLEALKSGLFDECTTIFNSWIHDLNTNTYIFCMSKHLDSEDKRGRLSMWRGYGDGAKVAIIINSKPLMAQSDYLGIYSNGVNYIGEEGLTEIIDSYIKNLEVEKAGLESLDLAYLSGMLYRELVGLALTTKHNGFEEELEWRIYQTPAFGTEHKLEEKIVNISGIPQKIKALKFGDYTEFGIEGADLESLLDRVIIGPSEDQLVIYDSFVSILKDAGISNSEQKVFVSDIPYRA